MPPFEDAPADFSEYRQSGDTIFSGKVISVQKDTVRLPDGGTATREVVRHPGAVVIVPFVDEQTVLLEWQYRYPLGRHLWEVPAGKLEAGEDRLESAKRELVEETGYQAGEWREILSFISAAGFCDEELSLFFARNLSYVGHKRDEGEFLHVEATSLEKAWEMLAKGDITDAKTIIALLWIKQFGYSG